MGDAEFLCLLAEYLGGVRGGAAHGLQLVAELLKLAPPASARELVRVICSFA